MNDDKFIDNNLPEEQNRPAKKEDSLFEKIKSLQSLPDEVVERFLKCKGTLRNKKFILQDVRKN